ncbi:MAG: NAD(P)-binding domain-containing protein [Methanobrevibacter sp.]|nr:NAD(P)-binding domain-containing protein [Methanobrevibacter sp.]
MNLGIIGYGNIGELLVQNILNIANDDFNKLYISNRHIDKIEFLKDNEIVTCTDSNTEVSRNCEKIIICVQTPMFFDVLEEIYPDINENTHLIYCCAGIDNKKRLENYPNNMTCIIPTIASTYDGKNPKKGVSLIKHDENVSTENKDYIEKLFNEFSDIKIVKDENELEILTFTTSCMPAFISLAVEKLASQLSLNSSIDKEEFLKLLITTNMSTSQLLNENTFNNEDIIKKVATKNGITEKGLRYLDDELIEVYTNLIGKII